MKKENGFYFGLNEVKSKNIIMSYNEKISHKKNEIILGTSGGGMGFIHKIEQIKNLER